MCIQVMRFENLADVVFFLISELIFDCSQGCKQLLLIPVQRQCEYIYIMVILEHHAKKAKCLSSTLTGCILVFRNLSFAEVDILGVNK